MIGSFGFVSAAPFTEIDAGLRLTTNKSVRLTCNCQPDFTLCRKNIQKFYHIIAANPADGEYALDLLMIAKYCERIGDHCTNIAEWVEFSVTGQHKSCQ